MANTKQRLKIRGHGEGFAIVDGEKILCVIRVVKRLLSEELKALCCVQAYPGSPIGYGKSLGELDAEMLEKMAKNGAQCCCVVVHEHREDTNKNWNQHEVVEYYETVAQALCGALDWAEIFINDCPENAAEEEEYWNQFKTP